MDINQSQRPGPLERNPGTRLTHSFTFLRHAESQGNALGYLQGRTDVPLSEKGAEQVRRLAETWRGQAISFDRIFSSSLKRAVLTAEIIASILGGKVEIDPNWSERYFGEYEGRLLDDLRQQNVDFNQPYDLVGESGESQVDVYLRALAGVQKLVRLPAGRYLIVSHGSFLSKVLYAILGITPQGHYNSPRVNFRNLMYLHLTYNAARRQWTLYNFTCPELWNGQLGE